MSTSRFAENHLVQRVLTGPSAHLQQIQLKLFARFKQTLEGPRRARLAKLFKMVKTIKSLKLAVQTIIRHIGPQHD